MLGLKRVPPLRELLLLAAGPDISLRPKALNFLLDNFVKAYSNYNPADFYDLAFIPALDKSGSKLAKPAEVSLSFTEKVRCCPYCHRCLRILSGLNLVSQSWQLTSVSML